MRAGAPSMSGIEANSTKSTRMTPLVAGIGDGNGLTVLRLMVVESHRS